MSGHNNSFKIRKSGLAGLLGFSSLHHLTQTQKLFVKWNAHRLGISEELSFSRYQSSWCQFEGGHKGDKYRAFNDLSYGAYGVFYSDDNPKQIFDSYHYFSIMHFLRMLSYKDEVWDLSHPVVQHLLKRESVTILDFGCGLAQKSRSLCTLLADKGLNVNLVLADIITIRKEFLLWVGERSPYSISFLGCTASEPIPPLPSNDLCVVLEFLEHVHNPVVYFDKMNESLNKNGLFYTDVSKHQEEFMHVSCDLTPIKNKFDEYGYTELEPCKLYKK